MSSHSSDFLVRAVERVGDVAAARDRRRRAFREQAGVPRAVVIAGCGHLGRLANAGAQTAGLKVLAFADNSPALQGTSLGGVSVLSPAEAVARHGHEAVFIVAIYNGAPVRRQLSSLGCRHVVPYPLFFWEFSEYMPAEDRLELPERILEAEADFQAGYACLTDEQSREEFAAQIEWRCSLDYERLPPPRDARDMYFDPTTVQLTSTETLVDCGAFDGDSIRLFLEKSGGAFRAIYALEPDARNRHKLERYVAESGIATRGPVTILPFGASDRGETVPFEMGGTMGSRVVTESDNSIECRRLDDLLEDATPTLVKMDIEGAEPRALAGLGETIRRTRPILAVCAYHRCDHLWVLPRLMKEALAEYEIHLRRYAEECWETVYYAVPPERSVGIGRA